MMWLGYGLAILVAIFLALFTWRQMDHRADQAAWNMLSGASENEFRVFDHEMIRDLPEPAQRYFTYTIAKGTVLHRVVQIEMNGEMGLGTIDAPNYKPMKATQILAPPYGLVWKLKSGAISGSDGATPETSWTRFWLFNFIPVVRAGSADHRRSAFGRVVAEASFWAPASLLPNKFVKWEALSSDSARAIVAYGEFTQAVDIEVDEEGAPKRVIIQRWSNENPEKEFREQPFGGELSQFQNFAGYRLPTRVTGGNHIGTDAYFPFFKANVTSISFPLSR
jgi:hypothetical protein